MSVCYHDEKGPWDYSGKELPFSFKSGVLETSFSWLTSRDLGLSENLRHLARQAKVGVVSSESGRRPTVSNQFAPEVLEVTFLRPQRPFCLAYFWCKVCGYEAPRHPPEEVVSLTNRSARHDDPLDKS